MAWHGDCQFCGVSFDMHKADCPAVSGARHGSFRADELVCVSRAYPWRAPPVIGQRVWLASGSPPMLVLALDDDEATVGFEGERGPAEIKINWRCLVPHLFDEQRP